MPQPGLEPGPSDPESSTLTTGQLTPHAKKDTHFPIWTQNTSHCLSSQESTRTILFFTLWCSIGHAYRAFQLDCRK